MDDHNFRIRKINRSPRTGETLQVDCSGFEQGSSFAEKKSSTFGDL